MKFYLLEDPNKFAEYARFSQRGTWTKGKICESCGQGTSIIVEPLEIEWEPGSDQIGDFSWCGYRAVILDCVRSFLESSGQNCDYGNVVILQPHKPSKSTLKLTNTKDELFWLKANAYVELDVGSSDTPLLEDCAVCGQKRYKFRRSGLIINKESWGGDQIFKLKQFTKSSATYVTYDLLQKILSQGFTNFGYVEAGQIV